MIVPLAILRVHGMDYSPAPRVDHICFAVLPEEALVEVE